MSDHLTTVTSALKERFGAQDAENKVQPCLFIAPEQIAQAIQALRDEFGYDFLASLTASDYWPEETPRFHVVYQLAALKLNERVCLRVPVNGNDPRLPTVEGIYPVANWHERELWDMFGIRFDGHSDMRRILMPYDWVGHPLRKDYPLGYEEPQFTFNYEDIQVRKNRGRYEEA